MCVCTSRNTCSLLVPCTFSPKPHVSHTHTLSVSLFSLRATFVKDGESATSACVCVCVKEGSSMCVCEGEREEGCGDEWRGYSSREWGWRGRVRISNRMWIERKYEAWESHEPESPTLLPPPVCTPIIPSSNWLQDLWCGSNTAVNCSWSDIKHIK